MLSETAELGDVNSLTFSAFREDEGERDTCSSFNHAFFYTGMLRRMHRLERGDLRTNRMAALLYDSISQFSALH